MARYQLFQSTRPRGTRYEVMPEWNVKDLVSIHASARDAIRNGWRVTSTPCRFNPRVRAGRDLSNNPGRLLMAPVSIHASARDAIFRRGRQRRDPCCFNPRVRAGRDLRIVNLVCPDVLFQSTRPRGTRCASLGS